MARPTARGFVARSWELRPTSRGVVVMTAGTLLWMFLMDWPAWVCALVVIGIAAAVSGFFALLELSNEAADQAAESTQPETSDS